MPEQITLRDLADAWHCCAALGITSPTAAVVTDGFAGLLAAVSLLQGHRRPAVTLAATAAASASVAALFH